MAANASSLSPLSASGSSALLLMCIAFIVVKSVLVLPPSLLVLYLGLQRWRRRSFASCSHADALTLHSAAAELLYMLGVVVNVWGLLVRESSAVLVGLFLCVAAPLTVSCLNVLACVERYLAVVHPLLYRIRNVSIGCVWLLCLLWVGVNIFCSTSSPFMSYFCFLGLSLVVVSFCSLSVLRVLVRPGPGDPGRDRDRAQGDQAKRRAFHTITAVLAVLLLSFVGYLVTTAIARHLMVAGADVTVVMMSGYWWSLPSNLVLPALCLQRAGRPACCRRHRLTAPNHIT